MGAQRVMPVPVRPIGKRKTTAFVTLTGGECGGLREIELNEYPESPRGTQLRDRRVSMGLSLRTLATRLGITAEQLSGLEVGRYTLSDDDWGLVLDWPVPKAPTP